MKVFSRKLFVALLGVLLVYLNKKLDMGYSDVELLATAGVVVTYIFSQAMVDKEGIR